MLDRWREADNQVLSPASRALGHLPPSTSRPMDRHNPLLAMTVRRWMKNRGKTVKPKLTEEQTANLRMCFKMMDADGSGAIDADELHAAFKLLGLNVTKKEVEAMLAEVDRDGSGEVEYAEFLEIMTVQLNKMAEEAGGSSSSPARRAGVSDSEAPGAEGTGTPNAAALPFDIVATAYRRKKLLEALSLDDKDFLRSVAEEEERRNAEQGEQELQHGTPDGRSCSPGSRLSERESRSCTSSPSRMGLLPIVPQTNAEFLQTLGKDEKRIIEALTRKFRECQDAAKAASAGLGQRRHSSSAVRQAAAPSGRAALLGSLGTRRHSAVSPVLQQAQDSSRQAAPELTPERACLHTFARSPAASAPSDRPPPSVGSRLLTASSAWGPAWQSSAHGDVEPSVGVHVGRAESIAAQQGFRQAAAASPGEVPGPEQIRLLQGAADGQAGRWETAVERRGSERGSPASPLLPLAAIQHGGSRTTSPTSYRRATVDPSTRAPLQQPGQQLGSSPGSPTSLAPAQQGSPGLTSLVGYRRATVDPHPSSPPQQQQAQQPAGSSGSPPLPPHGGRGFTSLIGYRRATVDPHAN